MTDPRRSWQGHSRRMGDDVGDESTESRSVVQLLRIPPVIRPEHRTSVVVRDDWWVVVRRIQMGVSIWDALHSHPMGRWALSGSDVQAPWEGELETVWLLCNKAQ